MTVATLGEVADFINGFAFKPEDWHEAGLPIVRIQNLTDSSKPINLTTRAVPEKFRIRRGELLVSWSATLGVFVWDRTDEALVNQHIFRVVPRSKVDQGFLRHMLNGALDSMQRHLHGATMKHVNRGEFMATEIPLPTLDEQRRIAAILDHADALRAKRRQVLAHLDTLTQAIFNDMFGSDLLRGDRTELGSLASLITKGTTPTSVGLRFTDRGVPFLRAQNLQQGTVRFTSEDLFIDEVAHRTLKRSVIRPRDLLMSIAGTIGRVAIVPEHRPEMNCNQAVAIVRLSDPSLGTWLMCWLNSLDARGQIAASSVTATIANLSLGQIGRLKVPVATVDSMRLLAERVAAVRVKADIVTRSSAKFDDAFQSLQSRAFRGEL